MVSYKLKVNGKEVQITADEDTPLLWILRDELNLLGTKFGCGIGQCGACTVHVDGVANRSCLLKAAGLKDMEITTIEGLAKDDTLHPVQEAWKEHDVPQCGYCQAGQIMTASSFLAENPAPSTDQIRKAMHGNICRCAAYNRIEKAVAAAAKKI